ncbi:MAG: ACT domain-containing protein [Clostridia bacterium]|nr:ACT domain-containing protein [Clostridia bacterium]
MAVNGDKVGYLGPDGTYSFLAAKKLCPQADLTAYSSFFVVFKALEDGVVNGIVVPVENTVNGAVTQVLDLLQESENICATAACAVKVDHRLATCEGADLSKIERVYSHSQALAQCSRFLVNNLPQAKLIETSSTAESLDKIKSAEDAGIVGSHCQRKSVALSDYSVSDEEKNYTQFLYARKGAPADDAFSDRIFFSVTCRHRVGALVELLSILRESSINMTEIESRPIKNRTGEFRFFIEVEGNYADPGIKRALKKIETEANSYKLLGCYVCGLPK